MVKLYNAVVTENTASVMGGGMWFCPTGDATFTVTNGVALYDNRAEGAGDDFASLSGDKGTVTIADRFLGGGEVQWYRDGAVVGGAGNILGSVNPDVPVMMQIIQGRE